MSVSMIGIDVARALAKYSGLMCSVREDRLHFYISDQITGDLASVGSTLIDDTSGYLMVARHAVDLIIKGVCNEHR